MNESIKNKKPPAENQAVVLALVAVADYRSDFLNLVVEHFGSRFQLLTGVESVDPFTSKKVVFGPNTKVVKIRFFFNRRIIYQQGVLVPCVRADIVVLSLNPRILSVWIVLMIRKLLGKKTVLWGHIWPRAGKNTPTDRVRGWMRGLADVILSYTQTQAAELLEVTPDKTVIAMHNALYSKREMVPARSSQTPTDIIYVGRLEEEKKPELLLNAYAVLIKKQPQAGNLVFVGSGLLQDSLVQRSTELGLSERVRFTGHINDVAQLREYYSRAIVSVSPGYVGLSLIQSLGFGVPMIIADDEPHAPEVEAVREEENARFFTADSVESLARELVRFTDEALYWREKRDEISKFTRDRYSSEAMAAGFIAAVNGLRSDSSQNMAG